MLSTMIFIVSLFNLNLADSNLAIGVRVTELRILPNQYVIQKRTGNTLTTYTLGISGDLYLPSRDKIIDSVSYNDSTVYNLKQTGTHSNYRVNVTFYYGRYHIKPFKDLGNGWQLSFLSGIMPYIGIGGSYTQIELEDSIGEKRRMDLSGDIHTGANLRAGLQLNKILWGHKFYLNLISDLAGFMTGVKYSESKDTMNHPNGKLYYSSSIQPYLLMDYYGGPMTGLFAIYLLVEL